VLVLPGIRWVRSIGPHRNSPVTLVDGESKDLRRSSDVNYITDRSIV
jgi:hypothetical protein